MWRTVVGTKVGLVESVAAARPAGVNTCSTSSALAPIRVRVKLKSREAIEAVDTDEPHEAGGVRGGALGKAVGSGLRTSAISTHRHVPEIVDLKHVRACSW